ncbi:MFS transporter [Variovorax sp. E3]|uniref:MFS transporter n=1 Tax=Variovorax sp. E3 TaxID=1914993 RepID=UPI0027DC031A|nr:MFS transporter [Variovorax sp. E3]
MSSSASSASSNAPHAPAGLTPALTLVFAVACGLCVANIYYAQPLIGPISDTLQLHAGLAGLIMTLTQLGYGAGLLLLVPLADVVENRRLILGALVGAVIGLVGIALSDSAVTFLAASFVVGACAVAAQVLLPFASHLAPEATRGKVVGNIMAGLLGGIMLARPFASVVASALGWRAVFWVSAVLMAVLIAVLWRALPQRRRMRRWAMRAPWRRCPASCGTRRCCAGAASTRG